MKLSRAIREYVESKHHNGMRFKGGEAYLRDFLRGSGDIEIRRITDSQVELFLVAPRKSENTRARKYAILKYFFRFWILRGMLQMAPLPRPRVLIRKVVPPRVFTRQEVRLLTSIAARMPNDWGCLVSAATVQTFLLFVYGTGALLCEGVSLLRPNVDLRRGLITLHRPPTRLWRTIPVGDVLLSQLRDYESAVRHCRSSGTQTFFVNNDGRSILPTVMMRRFARVCSIAKITRTEGAAFGPRIYDLRHTFAVHTLGRWLAQGRNLRDMLPTLSAYLGHVHWDETEKYLALVPSRFTSQLASLYGSSSATA
jgi:integrase/recombinase XerD